MRRILLITVLSFAYLPAMAATWTFDPVHSTVGFSVRHMSVSDVKGVFDKVSGMLDIDDKDPSKSKVEITIEVASVNTRNEKRDADLRSSAGLFEVDKFPQITFKSTKVAKDKKGYKVKGDLTMHGVTKPVELVVEGPGKPVVAWGNQRIGVHAVTKVNRKDFGLNYGNMLANNVAVVGDEIKIDIDAEFTLPENAPAAAAPSAPAAPAAPKPEEKP